MPSVRRPLPPDEGNGTLASMDNGECHQDQARRAAERAQRLLAQPATLDCYDWGLAATLIVEADDALKRAQEQDPAITLPLLDKVVEELRDVTSNFTKPAFLRATKPERRQRPNLFTPRR
jgi:hypothetical protein